MIRTTKSINMPASALTVKDLLKLVEDSDTSDKVKVTMQQPDRLGEIEYITLTVTREEFFDEA